MKDKAQYVRKLFGKIATRYDLMNDLISFGLHKRWKSISLELTGISLDGASILDLGCGTGDYIELVIKKTDGKAKRIVGVDFSEEMLEVARRRLAPYITKSNYELYSKDVKDLSFLNDNEFSLITCGFTLRNVDDMEKVLAESYKKLKEGGALTILDLNRPIPLPIRAFSYIYVRFILPILAHIIAGASKEYLWLFESLKTFPTRKELLSMLKRAGFNSVKSFNFGLGVVALHIAFKS